jgi:heptose I phosphotransferase
MIYIKDEYENLFAAYKSVDDFLRIDINVSRLFKNRTTGRFEINGRGFYIKKHFPSGWGAVLDEYLRLRKAHIGAGYEKAALDKLESLGIDTLGVVAYGQDGKSPAGQKSFLITKELTNVQSLETICREWPAKPPQAGFKRALIGQIASISKKLHDNGVNHRDYYICHFLLDVRGGQAEYQKREPKLFLIDLHRAQIRDTVPFRWRVKDIGGLYFSAMDTGITHSDICRFMQIYSGKSLRETLTQDALFWEAVRRRAIKTYRKDFGKYHGEGSGRNKDEEFNDLQIDDWKIRIRKDFSDCDIKDLLLLNKSNLQKYQFTQVKSSGHTNVFKGRILSNNTNYSVYLKRYLFRSGLDFIKSIFRPSPAKRSMLASIMLQKNGFKAPEIIGLFERRAGYILKDNMLLTQEVTGAGMLSQLLSETWQNISPVNLLSRCRLIESFGQTIGRLHKKGIFHGDLRLGNVLVQSKDDTFSFFFIDNERTKKFSILPARLRLKNLVQINMFRKNISNIDRMRFFRQYCIENQLAKPAQRELADCVLKKTAGRLKGKIDRMK